MTDLVDPLSGGEPAPDGDSAAVAAQRISHEMQEIMDDRDSWKRTAEMYNTAWRREIAAFDRTIRRKSHHIDALVLTTRELVAKAREREAALPAAVSAWKAAEQERCDAIRACAARVKACDEAGVMADCHLEHARIKAADDALSVATQAMSVFFGCQPTQEGGE
jgi:hypothetical protein